MAAVYPLTIDQGETFRLSLVYANPPEVEGGPEVPIDLTDCTARMQVREKYAAPVLVEVSTDVIEGVNQGIILGGATGTIDITMTAEQTDSLGAKEGSTRPREEAVYDLELTFPGGEVRRVIQGTIAIDPNITRVV